MSRPDENDLDIDTFFQAARAAAPDPSDALMARVLADAEAVQAGRAEAPLPDVSAPRRGIWAALVEALGGWPALAGLATAAVAGVWVGAAAPDMVAGLAGLTSAEIAIDSGYDMGDIGLGGLTLAGDL